MIEVRRVWWLEIVTGPAVDDSRRRQSDVEEGLLLCLVESVLDTAAECFAVERSRSFDAISRYLKIHVIYVSCIHASSFVTTSQEHLPGPLIQILGPVETIADKHDW